MLPTANTTSLAAIRISTRNIGGAHRMPFWRTKKASPWKGGVMRRCPRSQRNSEIFSR
jgi:hypothetical protein